TERIKRRLIRSFPLVYRDDMESLWNEAGESLSRYLVALLISSLFQGAASAIVLFAIGVPYSLLLGVWTAIGALVPYVGSYIGGVPAVIVALFVSPLAALATAIAYFVINVIDGNLITPRVQGKAIGVHPVLVFLAVIVGGQIAGLWGALVSVPLLALVRTIADFLDKRLVVRDPGEPPTTISGQPIASPTERALVAGIETSQVADGPAMAHDHK
ncbi:MAG: AI-2E family transporter, partial [Thermomicrobiales bacterium]|nr:AI-2E family transporter [Thermomicrobiales bacterium]